MVPDSAVDVAVVGGGIVGLAAARATLMLGRDLRVCVLEKESSVASHQSSRNSGVVHAGVYYAPGSLKARLCTAGRIALKEYNEQRGIVYQECGKLIVALSDDQLPALAELHRRSVANGVPGIRMLEGKEIAEFEPAIGGIAALHSPATAITDFRAVARSFAADIEEMGGTVVTDFSVAGIEHEANAAVLTSRHGQRVRAGRVLVCAGLYGDRIARMAGDAADPRVIPFRGDYYRLAPTKAEAIRGLVYPVPDPAFPFLGVHLTRTVDGIVLVGPNAVLATAREGYRLSTFRWRDAFEIATWPGSWRLARRYWRVGLTEVRRAMSKRVFAREAAAFMPGVRAADLTRSPSGVRAQALSANGDLVDDFVITPVGRIVNVRNAPSPAASSSLPIGEELARRVLSDLS